MLKQFHSKKTLMNLSQDLHEFVYLYFPGYGLWCYRCVGSHPGCGLYDFDWRYYWSHYCPDPNDKCVKVIEQKGSELLFLFAMTLVMNSYTLLLLSLIFIYSFHLYLYLLSQLYNHHPVLHLPTLSPSTRWCHGNTGLPELPGGTPAGHPSWPLWRMQTLCHRPPSWAVHLSLHTRDWPQEVRQRQQGDSMVVFVGSVPSLSHTYFTLLFVKFLPSHTCQYYFYPKKFNTVFLSTVYYKAIPLLP